MKKTRTVLFAAVLVLLLASCGRRQTIETVTIRIPAGNTTDFVYTDEGGSSSGHKLTVSPDSEFVYTDEEISPSGRKLTVSLDPEVGEAAVVLKPTEVKEENAYEPIYLTAGMSAEIEVEKGAWFQVGLAVPNPSNEEIQVQLKVKGIGERRIADRAQEEAPVMQDLPPMVMVNGVLYQDTGKISSMEGRCGTMDGEITSAVDGTQIPTENDQSNFGTGYGYQFAAEDTIEILIDGKWAVYQARKAE